MVWMLKLAQQGKEKQEWRRGWKEMAKPCQQEKHIKTLTSEQKWMTEK